MYVCVHAEGRSCLDEILRGAAEAAIQVMIVGVDNRQPTSAIGTHCDSAVGKAEPPRLGVVAVGRQSGVANDLDQGSCQRQVEAFAVSPSVEDGGLVSDSGARVADECGAPYGRDGVKACQPGH